MEWGKPIVATGLAAALGLAGAACDGQGTPAAGTDGPVQGLEWTACDDLPGTPGGTFQCARLTVPLDYAAPGGETIGIAMIRKKATGPGERIGSLVFNFGGPGGSGVNALAQAAPQYKNLNTRYDLVSFDPRGVGRSAPVTCLDDRQMDAAQQTESSPDNAEELAAFDQEQKAYMAACQAKSGNILPHVGTLSAAKDLDRLRIALGDEKLNYFGISYGTWLGGNYAHQFPQNVGRAVLDGAVDTKISNEELNLQQAAAFEKALNQYSKNCVAQGAQACPPSKDAPDAKAITANVGKLLNRLDEAPLATELGRKLSQSLGVTGVATALYSKQLWPALTQGLTMADQGDGTILLSLADAQNGRDEDGHYTNINAANTAIKCDDTTKRYTMSDVDAALAKFTKASPVFGPSLAWNMLQCSGWPVKGDDAAKEVSAPGSAPIVVIGNTGDPATPYAWAPALAKELGSGVLLTLKGQGHGSYDTGDACIHKAVDAYLLKGKVPADGTSCP
ncbi:alpha/beta hydrolase [Streptosporangium sp. KLBMP 9127]|nr:alpha/beta hydrolase [Streptosporangium sp. KLBMP 9127]